jgi:protein-L-isoaspartate O-methyltransferase
VTSTTTAWTDYARRLADLLVERGDIHSPQWRAAVANVPRHVFVPRAYELGSTGAWVEWDTAGNWERVYASKTLVTALADRGGWQEPISSSTTPELMVRMLETLDVHDGHRVLEIGTGTGYNAALLSHRLGDRNVASVDIGDEFVSAARDRLASIGYHPTLAAVDGQDGLPDHGPYDRIIATCSVPAVPWTWAEQLAPTGTILVDVRPSIGAGNLVHLTRQGEELNGRFTKRTGSFMAMRHADTAPREQGSAPSNRTRTRRTDAVPTPWSDAPVAWFLAQLKGMPRGVVYGWELDGETGIRTVATLTAPDGATARISLSDNAVTETGTISLWEPVEHAYEIWTEAGHPGWDRLGMTVTATEQWVWLDDPTSDRRWQLHKLVP